MSTTSGTMRNLKVTDKDGNIFNMAPVDSEARQAIDEAKNLQFDEDYFTSELSQDETELSIGLNGVPIGVESPLKFIQDDNQGIVIGSDALTQSSADTLYYPLSNNPRGYLTEITGDFSGNNVSATTVNLIYKNDAGGGNYYTSSVKLNAGDLFFQNSNPGTSEGSTDISADNITLVGGGTTDASMTIKHNEIYIKTQGNQQYVRITPTYVEAKASNNLVASASWYDLISYITAHI